MVETVREGAARAFKLGEDIDKQEIIAGIGCVEECVGGELNWAVIGKAWVHESGAPSKKTKGNLGEGETLRVTNPMKRDNFVEAKFIRGRRGGPER